MYHKPKNISPPIHFTEMRGQTNVSYVAAIEHGGLVLYQSTRVPASLLQHASSAAAVTMQIYYAGEFVE